MNIHYYWPNVRVEFAKYTQIFAVLIPPWSWLTWLSHGIQYSPTPIYREIGGRKSAQYMGETVNQGTIIINLYIKLVFRGKETGTVYREKQ